MGKNSFRSLEGEERVRPQRVRLTQEEEGPSCAWPATHTWIHRDWAPRQGEGPKGQCGTGQVLGTLPGWGRGGDEPARGGTGRAGLPRDLLLNQGVLKAEPSCAEWHFGTVDPGGAECRVPSGGGRESSQEITQ